VRQGRRVCKVRKESGDDSPLRGTTAWLWKKSIPWLYTGPIVWSVEARTIFDAKEPIQKRMRGRGDIASSM
jgi:hypothetical protein